jgi:hypothetical protein
MLQAAAGPNFEAWGLCSEQLVSFGRANKGVLDSPQCSNSLSKRINNALIYIDRQTGRTCNKKVSYG